MRDHRLDVSGGLWRWALVIAVGIFATSLPQSGDLDLPIRNLLINKFGAAQVDPCTGATGSLHSISQFFGIVALPWYFKIVVGVFSDSIPLFGTMRRHYLLLSAMAASGLWLLAGQMQHSYLSLLLVITAMETMLVIGSTVMGALLVEVGQRLDAAGRLVSARIFVEGVCAVVAGPLAGILAGVPFGIAAIAGAVIAFTVVPVGFIWLSEPATAKYKVSALVDTIEELRGIFRSRALWIAAGFIFIASIPQIFPTPLWIFQKCDLKFSDTTIGYLRAAGGVGSMLAAMIYAVIYRRLSLRKLIAIGIIGSSFGSLSYLLYYSVPAAFVIETANGFLTTLWVLAMMEMSVWVVPNAAAAAAFALLMGAGNLGNAIGDYFFSELMDWSVFSFSGVPVLSAFWTLLVAMLLLYLPKNLFGPPER